MFKNCKAFSFDVGGHAIVGITGGTGPALLLLHGYPQTHVMWHKVAPALMRHFTIVAPDLTGYGNSGKPVTDSQHTPYSKRAMAADMLSVMKQLGYKTFSVAGHDRGGRVAHRLAVDHPKSVNRIAVLDIAPTREMYLNVTDEFARAYWHWYFLIQPRPFPERMILADTDAYLEHKCGFLGATNVDVFDPAAMECYRIAYRNPDTVHASCEDYRAAASIDIQHDNDDDLQGRRVVCPLHVLWGKDGVIERCFDPLALWRLRADHVSGKAMPGGHFLAEQHPDVVADELIGFFA